MSAVQYPFIDIAVHSRIRARLSGGEAIVIFSPDMKHALWANGRGAELFGHESIYDFLDHGTEPMDVSFRQAEGAARALKNDGDSRSFMMRITSGFQRTTVQAICELISIGQDRAILVAAPATDGAMSIPQCAARMIEGFDDTDTHRAVLDQNGQILAASPRFATLDLTPHTARMLVNMATVHNEGLVKRPVPTSLGYLPAAMGRVSDTPAMHLLFIVEPDADSGEIIPMESRGDEHDSEQGVIVTTTPAPEILSEEIEPEATVAQSPVIDASLPDVHEAPAADGYTEALDALADITEVDDEPNEEAEFEPSDATVSASTETEQAMADVRQALLDSFGNAPDTEGDNATIASEEYPDAEDEAETQADSDVPTDTVLDAEADPVVPTDSEPTETLVAAENLPAVTDEPQSPPAPMFFGTARSSGSEPFVFSPDMRATRFVWKIDAEGRFSEVSSEFARVVGPHAADINGLAFSDLAALFNFDPDGKIAELLRKRDTWSGKTIWWPIEGTTLKVPVDLAALPTYTRNREFDGFRGFGIVRVADVAEDSLAIGVTLVPTEAGSETDMAPDEMAGEIVDDIVDLTAPASTDTDANLSETEEDPFAGAATEAEAEADFADMTEDAPDAADEQNIVTAEPVVFDADTLPAPAEEKPALRLVETPARRHSDKVIQFEERRFRKEGLTPGEQAAFVEIGRRLDTPSDENEFDEVDTVAAAYANENAPVETLDADEQDAVPATDIFETDERPADTIVDAADDIDDSPEPQETAEEETVSDVLPLLDQAVTSETDEVDAEDDNETETEEPEFHSGIPVRTRPELTAEILDQMPVALIVHAGDTLFHANPEFLRLTGYETLDQLEEFGGLDALLQRDELEATTSEAGGMVVVRADDTLVPVSARLQSIGWDQSTALMLALMPVVTHTEPSPVLAGIADEPSSEALEDADLPAVAAEVSRLQVEVDELRSILETATDGVVIIGSEGDVRSMNRAASALFNYDNDETVGRPFVMLFAHESQRSVIDYLGGLSGHGVASVLNDGREVIGRESGGGFLPLFMTIGRLTSSNGYCAVIRDITQWKRTEEELRNAKRAAETANGHKSDFLAHVSHEIRTPLNAIIGFADMMATERFGPIGHPRYIEYANDIGRSGRHVLDIVNDLLDISKIEAGEMDLEFEAVGLNETVSEAVSIIQPQANGQRVIIRTALSQAVPQVVADLRSIKQIVLNILSNAIRFTPSGGQIVVSTAFEANGSVILRIRDTGVGMTRSELELAMKPFRQVTGAARKRGDGTGLGLPLTKAMVDANRASFAISSAPNEGTLVEVTFPSPRVLAN
ncbi:ATP-binding protein [Rhizobium panacihumi]|uniref:PAS domain-containing sensor histidine kinase n=1 Tax=Rhizobium panacihumi TaxID=2008450 RepID=UPI003D7A80B5